MHMQIQFWGATNTVTGSCHMLSNEGKNILLDCGMFQGKRDESIHNNETFAFKPSSIDAVLLSHAHLDHCGRLPLLVAKGFKQAVYATGATTDIATYVLMDSGKIQEQDVRQINAISHKNLKPLYTLDDSLVALRQFYSLSYHRTKKIASGAFSVNYKDAGHILGSSFLEVECHREGMPSTKVVFSGDLGRTNRPILRSPETPNPAAVLIIEGTYGNRLHDNGKSQLDEFCDLLNRVVDRGGKVIIPAFAVERAQEILYFLNILWNTNRLPKISVFMDSPMAANVTDVFLKNLSSLNDNVVDSLLTDQDPFGFDSLQYIRSQQMSERIARTKSPCIILAASGMCEGGRILNHLEENISNPLNAIVFVGYQAEDTLGRKIINGESPIKIRDKFHDVNAEVFELHGMSGHADSHDLRAFAKSVNVNDTLKTIFLVHGESEQLLALKGYLSDDMPKVNIIIPNQGEQFEI